MDDGGIQHKEEYEIEEEKGERGIERDRDRSRKLFDGKVYYIFKVFEMIYSPNASEYIYIFFPTFFMLSGAHSKCIAFQAFCFFFNIIYISYKTII